MNVDMAVVGWAMHRRSLLQVAKKWPRIRPGWPIGTHPLARLAHVNQWFHAISDAKRLAILEFLSQRDRCVTELQQVLDAPQSTVSYHLKVLRESGLVSARRDGRWRRRTWPSWMSARRS